jgi:acyl-CoA thioesterase FadM
LTLIEVRDKTVHWQCDAVNLDSDQEICNGTATRVYAEIMPDGNLRSRRIPDDIRALLNQFKEKGV